MQVEEDHNFKLTFEQQSEDRNRLVEDRIQVKKKKLPMSVRRQSYKICEGVRQDEINYIKTKGSTMVD